MCLEKLLYIFIPADLVYIICPEQQAALKFKLFSISLYKNSLKGGSRKKIVV